MKNKLSLVLLQLGFASLTALTLFATASNCCLSASILTLKIGFILKAGCEAVAKKSFQVGHLQQRLLSNQVHETVMFQAK